MDDFLVRALVAGIGVAVICGPLGCLVVWQRMAYFGAALSHAALLGVALGVFFQINLMLSVLGICLAVSFALLALDRFRNISSDTALAILAHASLALGIVLLSLMPSIRIDLMSYLFGDVLATSWQDVVWIYLGGIAVLFVLYKIWPPLISLIIQRDLALVDGVNERKVRLAFLSLLSIVIAVAMQIVGILLVVSLLIIPVASARFFSRSPEQMALISSVLGICAVSLGLMFSVYWNTPAGPSIVVAASGIFLVSSLSARILSAGNWSI